MVSTPFAASACTTAGTVSAPSGMKIASRGPPPAPRCGPAPASGLVERIALERDDAAAAPRHRLLEGGLDHRAVGIVRDQRGERAFAGRGGVARCGRRRTPAGSSRDRRRATPRWRRSRTRSPECCARARSARRADRMREQRPENDLGAFVERLLRRLLRRPAVPPSSFTRSWMSGALNSASAISAALRIDCAATPALPRADSGRIRPTLTWPVPIVAPGGACALCGGGDGDVNELSRLELPEQPANSALAGAASPARRGAATTGRPAHGAAFPQHGGSPSAADSAPQAQSSSPNLAFWRRMVNRMERIMISEPVRNTPPMTGAAGRR